MVVPAGEQPPVKAAWEKLLSGQFRVATRALRPAIDDSWWRCLVGQVDPGLAKVLSRIALSRREGLVPPRISINIVARQLREPRFVERLCELLESRGVPPEAICLEPTEGTLMEDLIGVGSLAGAVR